MVSAASPSGRPGAPPIFPGAFAPSDTDSGPTVLAPSGAAGGATAPSAGGADEPMEAKVV
eukprot:2120121-Prymnesium_polylepis.1